MHITVIRFISRALNDLNWVMQQIGSQIDNREIASMALVAIFILFAAAKGILRSVLRAVAEIAICALKPQILVPVFALIAYSMLIFWQMSQIHLWSVGLLLDSIIEVAVVGVPAIYIAVKSHTVKSIFKKVVIPEFNLSSFSAFYIGIETFSLPIELLTQFVIALLILIQATYSRNSRESSSGLHSDVLLTAISIAMFVCVTVKLVQDFYVIDWNYEMTDMLMALWYPLLVLPFVILLGYYSAIEQMFHRVRALNRNISKEKLIFLAVQMFPSLRCISHFTGYEANQYFQFKTYRERREYCIAFKRTIAIKASEADAKIARMKAGWGKRGFDSNGLWLDWENLEKIKSALWTVANLQDAEWKKNSSYLRSLQDDMAKTLVPKGCKFDGYISKDGSVYSCWISNGTGFTFGIGASSGIFPPLRYEGEKPPSINSNVPLEEFLDEEREKELPNWCASFNVDESYQ